MSIAAFLLFALAGVTSVIGWLSVFARGPRSRAGVLVSAISAAAFVSTAAGGIFAPIGGASDTASLFAVGRVTSIVCLGAAFLIFGFLITGRLSRERREAMRNPALLALAGYLLLLLVAVPFATVPTFEPQDVYGLLGVLAVVAALAQGVTPLGVVRTVRLGAAVVCALSVLWFLVDPARAATEYVDTIIGLQVRLHGLFAHANGLGTAAGLVLVLGGVARLRGENLWRLLAIAALVLSQSKTVWGAVALALIPLVVYRLDRFGRSLSLLGKLGLVVLALAGGYLVVSGTVQPSVDSTLTGRTALWQRVIDDFRANPIGGYGPTLLSEADDLRSEFVWAGHAHNQIIQTAGQSGLIGLVGLAILTVTLARGALRHARVTEGGAVAVLIFFFVRAVGEPLLIFRWDANLMIAVAVALMCAPGLRREQEEREREALPAPPAFVTRGEAP